MSTILVACAAIALHLHCADLSENLRVANVEDCKEADQQNDVMDAI